MPRLPKILLALTLLFAAGHVAAAPSEDERARNAVRVLAEIQEIPEQAIPEKLLDEARAIVVIPDTIKAGLVLGGRRGHGLMSVKAADGTWSNPVFVTLTGGSIGFQAGVQSADVVLVFRNDRSLDNVVNGKFTLGADAGVAAGPVGRNAAAATDGQLKAEIWSWSRARGLFAGVSLDGAVLQIDRDAQARIYGPNTTPRMVFEGRAQGAPSDAVVSFRDQLEEATHNARVARSGGSAAPASTPAVQSAQPVDTAQTLPAVPAQPATSGPAPSQGFEPVEDSGTRTEPLP
ncbi:lipid-binding SYLF domain-containing protein [Pseudoxanthomonas suwonensis]|uniref:lipid-binding SYLF domain-containing protein n=1 Tax=Pseudoxanthomonas suwonensis TaxID=314722 RepID=UPI0004638FDA|nr:lipid-binding SYLF domain-containing protein [Pseudoxanthomonas suwonensis]